MPPNLLRLGGFYWPSEHGCGVRMNAVEIEEAVSTLAEAPFDAKAFPYAFLEAFGNKETTLKRNTVRIRASHSHLILCVCSKPNYQGGCDDDAARMLDVFDR